MSFKRLLIGFNTNSNKSYLFKLTTDTLSLYDNCSNKGGLGHTDVKTSRLYD
ncbi:hypothetical protein C5167_034524 [Papaver somniferum]|uniref:Uncharacterized protein n=1 Tax=Papaver somniferum TaxID=3469 RepID=A0A4Y7KG39_PAPSO|nr:hypothetical protein C5167_034524 [Papaver somniferum]